MKVLAVVQTEIVGLRLGTRPAFPELRSLLPRIAEAVVLALEALLAYAWFMRLAPAGYVIAAHFSVVLSYFFFSRTVGGSLSGAITFRSAMLCLVGPLAAVGLVASLVAGACREITKVYRGPRDGCAAVTPSPTDLRGAHAEAVYAQMVAGRRSRRDPSNRQSLQQAIESGDLDAQQFAIAMISQRYEPEMFPALLSALQSSTPAVRVQAAAVFAKLRERMSSEAKQILQTQGGLLTDAPAALEPRKAMLAARCRHLADSGFVDAETGVALQRLAQALVAGGGPNCDTAPAELYRGHANGAAAQIDRRASATAVTKMPPTAGRTCSCLLGGG